MRSPRRYRNVRYCSYPTIPWQNELKRRYDSTRRAAENFAVNVVRPNSCFRHGNTHARQKSPPPTSHTQRANFCIKPCPRHHKDNVTPQTTNHLHSASTSCRDTHSLIVLRRFSQAQRGYLRSQHDRHGDAVTLRAQTLPQLPPHVGQQPEPTIFRPNWLRTRSQQSMFFGAVNISANRTSTTGERRILSIFSS